MHHCRLIRLSYSFFFLGSLVLPVPNNANASDSPQHKYVHELIERAKNLKLAQHRYWQILVHYEPTWTGVESEVDSPEFFLAPNGKYDPNAELSATIQAFFNPPVINPKTPFDQAAQCQFVARFHWLSQQLKFDQNRLYFHQCADFQKWIQKVQPESVSLIFPSYFLEAPASMYGHTLLRINRKGLPLTSPLNYAVNYAAMVDVSQEFPLIYMLKGTFGGYYGRFALSRFALSPYYLKIQEYNNHETRDLWEYELSLNQDEVLNMMRHMYELDGINFNYYYFRKNCSYHLLSLLEAARPSLHLREKFPWVTLPGDTVRVVVGVPGLVVAYHYRPSKLNRAEQRYADLDSIERRIFDQIVSVTPQLVFPEEWRNLSDYQKAKVLELLSEYYLIESSETNKNLWKQVVGTVFPKIIIVKVDTIEFIHVSHHIENFVLV